MPKPKITREAPPRPETGYIAFGDDWPGVFIRGDNAFAFAHSLELILGWVAEDGIFKGEIERLRVLLAGVRVEAGKPVGMGDAPFAQLRPFAECVTGDREL